MRRPAAIPGWLLLGALAFLPSGCGGQATHDVTPGEVRRLELEEIREMYKLHLTEKHRPPTQLAQLKPYEAGFTNGYQALQSGQCLVVWGADLSESGGQGVLVYDKDVPGQGGLVLLRDGTIRDMTAEEFKAARKSP
jgi:hypothetical protein